MSSQQLGIKKVTHLHFMRVLIQRTMNKDNI